MLNDNCLL